MLGISRYCVHNIKLRSKKKKINFGKEVEKNILTWNRADAILYDHFNKTFWRKVREVGSTFDEELKTFRRINQEYQESCKSTEDQKCKLSKRNPCGIFEQLWKKRGYKYSGPGCGPRTREIARGKQSTLSVCLFSLSTFQRVSYFFVYLCVVPSKRNHLV